MIPLCSHCSNGSLPPASSTCCKCLDLCSIYPALVWHSLQSQVFPQYTGMQSLSFPIALPACLLIREKVFFLLFSQELGLQSGLKETFKALLPADLPVTVPGEADLSVQITFHSVEQSVRDFDFLLSLLPSNISSSKELPRKKQAASNAVIEHLLSLEANIRALRERKSEICAYFAASLSTEFTFALSPKGKSVFVAGKYCKLERGISQTPWIIGGKSKTEFSVSGIIEQTLAKSISFCGSKFCSAGREDADVRMLGEGRPFLFELLDVHSLGRALELEKEAGVLQAEFVAHLEYAEKISANSLCIVDGAKANAILKKGEEEKEKTYRCTVWTREPFSYLNCPERESEATDSAKQQSEATDSTKQESEVSDSTEQQNEPKESAVKHSPNTDSSPPTPKLDSLVPIQITQRTPIRVLQRRALLDRQRTVLRMQTIPIDAHHFELILHTEAGTYIKEFVHGDFGRTRPSIGGLFGSEVDILDLDVLSVHLPEW